jgi:tRNA(His) 5'-end guanylyltransferase
VDGKAFHTYPRRSPTPFDEVFVEDMGEVAKALCTGISGAVFAYQQSDEISILIQDWQSIHTEPWFAGELQKIVSICASVATSALSACRASMPLFDARAFILPNTVEVANYFMQPPHNCETRVTVGLLMFA